MAPSKDKCEFCQKAFYGKQKIITCCGPCGFRFHLECANITEEDYNYLIQDGISTYKCNNCVASCRKDRNDDTPVKSVSPKKLITPGWDLVLLTLEPRDNHILSVQLETLRLNGISTMEMTQSLIEMVTKLSEEVTMLKTTIQS